MGGVMTAKPHDGGQL